MIGSIINEFLNNLPIFWIIVVVFFSIFCFISGILMLFVPFWIIGMRKKIRNTEKLIKTLSKQQKII